MEGQLVCLACELERAGHLVGQSRCAELGHERSLLTGDGAYHFLKSARAEKLSRSEEYDGRWVDLAGNLYEEGNALHVTQYRSIRGREPSPVRRWRIEPLTVTGRAT